MVIDRTSDKSCAAEPHNSIWSRVAADLHLGHPFSEFQQTPSKEGLSSLPSCQITGDTSPEGPSGKGGSKAADATSKKGDATAKEGDAKTTRDQQTNEHQLNGPDHATKNLIADDAHKFTLETKANGQPKGQFEAQPKVQSEALPKVQSEVQPKVQLSTSTDKEGNSKITIDIHSRTDGEPTVFSQPINYQFKPVTDLQKKFQQDHPNVDLGHLVHVQFKAKSTGDNNMEVQIMGSEPPYKQSMTQRIDLNDPHRTKDKDGYTNYDFYEVVPSTKEGAKPLNFKLNLGSDQNPGTIDVVGLSLKEVDHAPGIDPAAVIKQYEQPVQGRENHDSSFMFGAIGNKLVDQNIWPSEQEYNNIVQKAMKDHPDYPNHPDDLKAAIKAGVDDYKKKNTPTMQEKEQFLQQLKDEGINTLTIPVYWNQIESEKGKADYSPVDQVVDLAQKYGMKVKLHPVAWTGCYPDWVDKGFDDAKKKDPGLSMEQYTKDVTKDHIDQVIKHFGKFGNEIGYVEINEMNSSELLQQAKKDNFGRVERDANGHKELENVDNGLTKWIVHDGPAAVINQVDAWIKQDLSGTKGMEDTKLLANEYLVDEKTQSNDLKVSQDPNHPYAYGFEAHQFDCDATDTRKDNAPLKESLNESDSLLSMYQQFGKREPGDMKTYLSELTVETTAAPHFDETKMSAGVVKAEKEQEDYDKEHNLKALDPDQRKAQEEQAEELLAWYKTAAANKGTTGISLWDAGEKNAWLGNTGGEIDAKGDPKISYFALKDFIHDFETPKDTLASKPI